MRRRGVRVLKKEIPEEDYDYGLYHTSVPSSINAVFKNDYDIFFVNDIIRQKFVLERFYRLPELENQLQILSNRVEKPMTIAERIHFMDEISSLQQEVEIIKTKSREKEYIEQTKALLRRYQGDFPHVRSSVFSGTMEERHEEPNEELITLIHSYLYIAANYITINIVHIRPPLPPVCYNCMTPLSEEQCNSFLRISCRVCHAEQVSATLTKNSKDAGATVNRHKEDDTLDNFLKTWTQKQGREIINIPDSLYRKLDQYFSSHGCPIGAEIKLMPLNPHTKKRGNTNHDMLHEALKCIKEPDYYKNMDYIGREYFGWENWDFEYLREIVISDYLETQTVFLSLDVSFRERQSSPGTQYRLRKQLQMRGFEIPQCEFKIAKNPQSRRNHNRVWKIMVENSGNPEHRYIED